MGGECVRKVNPCARVVCFSNKDLLDRVKEMRDRMKLLAQENGFACASE